jgi:hypothetical protein
MKSSSAAPRKLFRRFFKLTTMSAINTHLTFGQLYADPSSNPLGTTEEEARESYRVIYSAWRIDDSPPTDDDLEDGILPDFIAPIGAITIMVAEEGMKTRRVKVTHCYERYPGLPGKAHPDRRANFAFEGDADGTDAYIFAVDKNQWGLTPYVNVPQFMDRHLAMLEPPLQGHGGALLNGRIGRPHHSHPIHYVHPF